MLNVNLEKKLLRENAKVFTDKELLQIQEYDRLSSENLSNLTEVFPNLQAAKGAVKKNIFNQEQEQAKNFDQERVFHITQIEKICNKYRLRFLPSSRFSGSIDTDTVKKITEFELSNDVKLFSKHRYDSIDERTNAFICAPAQSFKLEPKPKDPLLFYKINDSYYYLIHKWGKDLSVTRRLRSIFTVVMVLFLIFTISIVTCFILNYLKTPDVVMGIPVVFTGISGAALLVTLMEHEPFNYTSPIED